MIPSTAEIRFVSGGMAQVDTALYLTSGSHVRCCTYPHRPPILAVHDRHVSVTVSVPDPDQVSAEDVEVAARLAKETARYATELAVAAQRQKDKAADADAA